MPILLRMFHAFLFSTFLVFASSAGLADTGKESAALPIPRFVTLAADEVNLRTGPGLRYPIKYYIYKNGLPVEIVKEFEHWRQIKDSEGDVGWVHKSLLSGKRAVMIKGSMQTLAKNPSPTAKPVVKVEPEVIAGLLRCEEKWCQIEVGGYKGWLQRDVLWGIYPDEQY